MDKIIIVAIILAAMLASPFIWCAWNEWSFKRAMRKKKVTYVRIKTKYDKSL